jgi:small-conductance mechanosensitive channel
LQPSPSDWHAWLWPLAVLVGSVALSVAVHWALYALGGRLAQRSKSVADDSFVRHTRGPAGLALPLVAAYAALPVLPLPDAVQSGVRHALLLALIGSVAWMVVAMVEIASDVMSTKYPMDTPDNLEARRVQTQLRMLRRVSTIAVSVIAGSIMLMTFPGVRHVGVSLFASAGVAGIVIGLAMRPTISNLVSGVQIAFTQPIRLDDVVIVNGEWGRIEEINTIYVVVRIWDLRRMIVPLSYFIEQPFQNWTRVSADLLGTAYVYADYRVPVEEVRQELRRVLESSDIWDGKVWGLQVTNASERTIEMRALMSAPDSSQAWNLRCYVREKLIAFLQREHPDCLPVIRAEIGSRDGEEAERKDVSPIVPA